MLARLAIRCDESPHGDLPAASPLFSDLPDDMKPARDTITTSVRLLSNVGWNEEEGAASLQLGDRTHDDADGANGGAGSGTERVRQETRVWAVDGEHGDCSPDRGEQAQGWNVVERRGECRARVARSSSLTDSVPRVACDRFVKEPPPSSNVFEVLGELGAIELQSISSCGEKQELWENRDTMAETRAAGPAVDSGDGVQRRGRRLPFGAVAAHARFLQYLFRRIRMLRPGCWRRGGVPRVMVYRPATVFGCRSGLTLASEEAIDAQRERSRRVLAWYANYPRLHRRLHLGRTPTAVVTFCGGGGATEGVRRAGGAAHGQDLRPQPDYVRRYGAETFSQGDSCSPHELRRLCGRTRSVVTLASPPCKDYSSSRMRGKASEPPLIRQTRDALTEVGGLHVIENVPGAARELRSATLLRGAYFGLKVDRPRLFESNFELHVDRALKEGGDALRKGMCLGRRRRWRRLDPFGRPEMCDCCSGNIWSVQGDKPLRCTAAECAEAMGLDRDHMAYAEMTQALPPAYTELLFAQACMRSVEAEFSIPAITYDEYELDPAAAERRMSHLIVGAGGASPHRGVEFLPAASSSGTAAEVSGHASGVPAPIASPQSGARSHVKWSEVGAAKGTAAEMPAYEAVHKGRHAGGEIAAASPLTVREAELRELEYSWAGGYDVAVVSVGDECCAEPLDWLLSRELLEGGNTLVSTNEWRTKALLADAARLAPGTRVTFEARGGRVEALLREAGCTLVRRIRRGRPAYAADGRCATLPVGSSFWAWGEEVTPGGRMVDYAALDAVMDPLDREGAPSEPKSAKAARSYMPIPIEPARWDIGLPAELNEMMAGKGVGVHVWEEPGFSEVPFYPFANDEALLRSIQEADRAIIAGAMEYIPADQLDEVRRVSTVHPWTVVDQGGGKWRLCHDYSVGLNRVASTAPFSLPSVWDVAPSVGPSTHFAKYDIRDGFWHCPIAKDARKRFVVRHPGTGRLMWASRLPFGYLDSPRLFCGLTEAIISRCRARAAGLNIRFYVFVDDCLVVGSDESATRAGMAILEAEFAALGVQWAPHKKRGPCQCIEFLGLLLANTAEWSGVTVSRKRYTKLMAELDGWAEREPATGLLKADPKEVASTLGKLVFASQVVPNGRTYMQGMLAAFKGLVVDWQRGTVAVAGRSRLPLELQPSFWRDLSWWRRHLGSHSFTTFESVVKRPVGELAITGTDASDWGTGQVLWSNGAREEYRLIFTAAEKRRSINWRELLGIYRVAKLGGERLRGKLVLVEGDNMAAVGAARKFASKSEDMQELVRRMLRLSRRHGFTLRVTHTPGEKLDRPDQTSRGDPIEEPRSRLQRNLFERVAARVGGFTSYVGAEREHRLACPAEASSAWAHPTYNTVGTALRRVGELLADSGSRRRAVALVPLEGGEQWNKMLRHGICIGRFDAGSRGVEESRRGAWVPSAFRRPSQLVLFPRAAGATPRRLSLSYREGITPGVAGAPTAAAGYRLAPDGASFLLDPMPGSFVYSMPTEGNDFGCLYQVVSEDEAFSAQRKGGVGVGAVFAREAVRASSKAAQKMAASEPGGWVACEVATAAKVWQPEPRQLWTVDAYVKSAGGARTFNRFLLCVPEAHRAIEQLELSMPRANTQGWDLCLDDEEWEGPSSVASNYESFAGAAGGGSAADGGEPSLSEVTRQLDDLALKASPAVAGPGGALRPDEQRCRQETTEGDRSGAVDQPCPYGQIVCVGCGERIAYGMMMRSVIGGVTHANAQCERLAREIHAQVLADEQLAREKEEQELEARLAERGACREQELEARLAEGGAEGVVGRSGRTFGNVPLSEQTPADEPPAAGDMVEAKELVSALGVTAATERERPPRVQYAVYSEEVGATGIYATELEALRWLEGAEGAGRAKYSVVLTEEEGHAFIRRCNHEAARAGMLAPLPGEGGVAGSNTARAHLAEKLAPQRLAAIENCIAGKCGHEHGIGLSTACRKGCGRWLHVETCAEMGRGYAALGNFVCPQCRLAEMLAPGATASDSAQALALRTAVIELTQGRETTAASYSAYVNLEEKYVTGLGSVLGEGLRLPRHNPEAFKNFVSWLALDADRARSLESVVRTAGAFMTKLELPDVTKDKGVKAHVRTMLEICGTEHEPATAATPRMLCNMLVGGGVIDRRYGFLTFVGAREKVQVVFEGVGGCRIGEVVGSGDSHGLLANETAILTNLDGGGKGPEVEVVVEAKLEHSKTGYSRYLDLAGTTASGIECAQHLRVYWQMAGFTIETSVQAGVKVERPDFWTIRVSLLAVDQTQFMKLRELLGKWRSTAAPKPSPHPTMVKAEQRWKASGPGSQAKKYCNVGMGPRRCPELRAMLELLQQHGFEARLVPGPLLLATGGGTKQYRTAFPLSIGTAFAPTKELLELSCQQANHGGPDPDLDGGHGRRLLWTTHSLRRLADSVARRDREKANVTEAEIDLYFGWHEAILLKEMQRHYEAMSIRSRMKNARITQGI